MTTKFSRKIKLTDPILPYNILDNSETITEENIYTSFNNCHWGALKLFYSEMEFLVKCSKYIDITKCLIVYIGAASGYRLKHLFLKFFPNTKYLLYDPNPFEIDNDENFIIKTGSEGWFSDNKISEILEIANGREILYLSDIRISSSDSYEKEKIIHDNLQDQQRWGVMMNAKFMLLKFRMFFYQKDPNEIDFINNKLTDSYKDKLIYDYDKKKHENKNRYFLHLDGDIYTQIYAGKRSTETRLFVKRDNNKYRMRYYDNIEYEGLLNYFNLKIRSEPIIYKESDIIKKYIPGSDVTYTSASEYYIICKYLRKNNLSLDWQNIIKKIIYIYIFMNNTYTNNLILCINKNIISNLNNIDKNIIIQYYEDITKKYEKQFKNLRNCDFLTNKQKGNFIQSYNGGNKYISISNGKIYIKK